MGFPAGVTVWRHRRKQTPDPDPYRPGKTTTGDWDDPDVLPLPGAFIASASTSAISDATRSQIVDQKSLYLTDVTLDVLPGDRVGGQTPAEAVFAINGSPQADTNPWTGWQPVKEIPLEEVKG